MMKKLELLPVLALLLLQGCTGNKTNDPGRYTVIPAPVELVALNGSFTFDESTVVTVSPMNEETSLAAEYLAALVRASASVDLPVSEGTKVRRNMVHMTIDTSLTTGTEGYELRSSQKE